jgi:hypothetical protein
MGGSIIANAWNVFTTVMCRKARRGVFDYHAFDDQSEWSQSGNRFSLPFNLKQKVSFD